MKSSFQTLLLLAEFQLLYNSIFSVMKRIFREENQDRNLLTETASNSGNNGNTNAIETGRGNNEYKDW